MVDERRLEMGLAARASHANSLREYRCHTGQVAERVQLRLAAPRRSVGAGRSLNAVLSEEQLLQWCRARRAYQQNLPVGALGQLHCVSLSAWSLPIGSATHKLWARPEAGRRLFDQDYTLCKLHEVLCSLT